MTNDLGLLRSELQELARRPEGRPKAALLREVLDDVEAALAAGRSRDEVRAALARHGIVMSARTFASTLWRLRNRKGTRVTGPAAAAPAAPAATPSPATAPSPVVSYVLDPLGLDEAARRLRERKRRERPQGEPAVAPARKPPT